MTQQGQARRAAPAPHTVHTASHGTAMPGTANIAYIQGWNCAGTPSTSGKRTTLAVAHSA